MINRLEEIAVQAALAVDEAKNLIDLEQVRVKYLGKKGEITSVLKEMGKLPSEERPLVGQKANDLRVEIEEKIDSAMSVFSANAESLRIESENIDITLPGKKTKRGNLHPLTIVMEDIKRIFIRMGFSVEEGPEMESDYYNFEALNFAADHPARDMQDSFYLPGGRLLRTHTSPVQVRTMQRECPHLPIRIVAPGRVYRKDDMDSSHSMMFTQIEGLVIDKSISFADLKGTIEVFAKEMFGADREVRFRPSFFPFTEPSAEVDVSCIICGGAGCRMCKGSGWLEILGSGMVHPRVLEMSGYDPNECSGFAFGMGIERIAILKYGIEDIRLFYENDLRFLKQF